MVEPVPVTRLLADYASGTNFAALPASVHHEAARALLNWFGVAIAGSSQAPVSLAAEAIRRQGTAGSATILGQGATAAPGDAAFVNCIASSLHAFDDAHLATVAHPSGPAVASALAMAECVPTSGAELLNAIALSIEVQCRVAETLVLPPSTIETAIYVNGFSGPIGVAAGAGRLLGLDVQRMTWALGLAASQASGFRATHGTMTAHFRPGHATRAGIHAAFLAEQGFDCTEDALEAPGGLIDTFAHGGDLSRATEGLGSRHEMLTNRYKPYPCGIVIHPVIDACLEVREAVPPGVGFATVELLVNPLVPKLTGKRAPKTTLESHVSVFHWAAVALLHGAAGLAQSEPEWLVAPDIAALRGSIIATPVEGMGKGEAKVRVTLTDGRSLEAHVLSARGSLERPLTDADLLEKFTALALREMDAAKAASLAETCLGIATAPDAAAALRSFLA